MHDTGLDRATMSTHEQVQEPVVEDYRRPSTSLRVPSVQDSGDVGHRQTSVQQARQTTSSATSISVSDLHGSTVSVASQSTVQTDPELVPTVPIASGGATRNKSLTSTDVVRAALLAAPQIDSGRATRIAQLHGAHPQPTEQVAPMIVEKRVDYLPRTNSREDDPTELSSSDADTSIPLTVAPNVGKIGQKVRRKHHTVQPAFPTPAGTVTADGDAGVEQALAKKKHHRLSLQDPMSVLGTARTSLRSGQVPVGGTTSRSATGPKRFLSSRKGTIRDSTNNEVCIVM